MNLDSILTDLKAKRRALDAAITALESLHRKSGRKRPRSSLAARKQRQLSTRTAAAERSNRRLILFPGNAGRIRLENNCEKIGGELPADAS